MQKRKFRIPAARQAMVKLFPPKTHIERMGAGLVDSRFNHPNSEIVEDRLSV